MVGKLDLNLSGMSTIKRRRIGEQVKKVKVAIV